MPQLAVSPLVSIDNDILLDLLSLVSLVDLSLSTYVMSSLKANIFMIRTITIYIMPNWQWLSNGDRSTITPSTLAPPVSMDSLIHGKCRLKVSQQHITKFILVWQGNADLIDFCKCPS